MLNILRSDEINNRLLCEIVTHAEFRRLLTDIEIYVDRIASSQIDNLNAWVATMREKLMEERNPGDKDLQRRTLEAAFIQEDKYFTHTIHADMDVIITDIREAHKKDISTADDETIAAKLRRDIEDTLQFRGTDQERVLRLFCNQLDIPYDKLTPEESAGVIGALKKSKRLWNAQNKRGKTLANRKGKQKKS